MFVAVPRDSTLYVVVVVTRTELVLFDFVLIALLVFNVLSMCVWVRLVQVKG